MAGNRHTWGGSDRAVQPVVSSVAWSRSSGSAACRCRRRARAAVPRSDPRGITSARSLAFGASTPWKRIRRGRGTSAARRCRKSSSGRVPFSWQSSGLSPCRVFWDSSLWWPPNLTPDQWSASDCPNEGDESLGTCRHLPDDFKGLYGSIAIGSACSGNPHNDRRHNKNASRDLALCQFKLHCTRTVGRARSLRRRRLQAGI